jgi:hypothetical protein
MSYVIGIGRLNAEIATKCIDQMPMPITNAAPINQAVFARSAKSQAVYPARTAIAIESDIRRWWS